MARAFCIPGLFFLFAALVLNFLVSISLPYLPALDITRVHFGSTGVTSSGSGTITESRLGIWTHCDYEPNGDKICGPTSHGYSVPYHSQSVTVTIGPSWTRGLAVHPVATAVTFFAFLLAFSTHITVTLISSMVSFLAALLTLIAFAIDIALFVYLRHQTNKLTGVARRTNTAPGFWMTFGAFILLLLAGCTVCFGRRRDRMSGASTYPSTTARPGFFSRFRRRPKY